MQMSFSEYNGSKTKVTQAVGRIFKNAQESFTKIQPTHGKEINTSYFLFVSFYLFKFFLNPRS